MITILTLHFIENALRSFSHLAQAFIIIHLTVGPLWLPKCPRLRLMVLRKDSNLQEWSGVG